MIHEYIIKVDDDKRDIMGGMPLKEPPKELVRCKDCKSFGIKEHWINAPLPVLVATVPTCTKLEIKTHPEGYCFLAKRK